MLVRSYIVPVEVQTGWEKGWSERLQKLKGRRLKVAWGEDLEETFAPALAE